MQILSRALFLIGLIALLAGIGILIYSDFEVWKQWIAVSASRSREFSNPVPHSALGAAVLALGSFLAGLGISLPRR